MNKHEVIKKLKNTQYERCLSSKFDNILHFLYELNSTQVAQNTYKTVINDLRTLGIRLYNPGYDMDYIFGEIMLDNNSLFNLRTDKQLFIDSENLSDNDLDTIAYLISESVDFMEVFGIPNSGLKLAEKLKQYVNPNCLTSLIVDDVVITGDSFKKALKEITFAKSSIRVVAYSIFDKSGSNDIPEWINCLFTYHNNDDFKYIDKPK